MATKTDEERIKPIAESEAKKLLAKEDFRQRVKEIIGEYFDSVPCMKKVQGYADEQINTTLFKSWKFLGGIILSTVLTTIVLYALKKIGLL